MKKKLLVFLFLLCNIVAYGQYKEYSKSDLETDLGITYKDIRLSAFKDGEHAQKVLKAISHIGHQRNNSYYITDKGDFVVQILKKASQLFKNEYVLFYKPRYEGTMVVLEFYKLAFNPWDQAANQGRSSAQPEANLKQVQLLVDEVKQLATLYAGNDTELQSVLNEQNKKLTSIKKAQEEEEKASLEKFTNLQVEYSGFSKEEYAYEALNESVRDFNNKIAEQNNQTMNVLTDAVNWKKISSVNFFEDNYSPYKGKLLTCAIGKEGSVQSGYIIFNADYNVKSSKLIITRLEMLKVPGVTKKYYERSKFGKFKNVGQLGLTSDETYQKHAAYILDELVSYLNQYKNNAEFLNQVSAKKKNEESRKKEIERKIAEEQKKDVVRREVNLEINEKSFKLSNKSMLSLQEGDIVCLNAFSDRDIESIFRSDIIAYVEKYNSAKTKLQLRIHQASQYAIKNIYENTRFEKGDLIWINLPMKDSRQYWSKCE